MSARLLSLVTSLLFFFLFVAGCGTTGPSTSVSYEASDNQTNFQTGTMTVGRLGASGYGSNTSILLNAQAQCSGRNCTPERARLSFLIQGSSSDVAISNRSVSLVADGKEYAHRSAVDWRSQEDIRMSQGRIASLTLPLSALSQIANASSLSGRLGSNKLSLDRGVRTKLKQFVQTMRNPAANTSSNAS
ncbi:MAG: hypothetical protein ABEL97_14240 [Salinibacter sp.]